MRDEFSWYFKASDEEIQHIWESGLLTLDANVLLDLYRYHENTRNSLMECIGSFEGRLWLSRQAAEEFFRNRTKVIISATRGFKLATDELEKLKKSLVSVTEQLDGNRIIASEIASNLRDAITTAIGAAETRINEASSCYPKFLQHDPLLEKLLEIFSGSVGPAFSEEDLKKARAEGEQRKKACIPPGFLDDDKDGDRPFGDYFLWKQVLERAKVVSKPIILVTSERKEDWWEKHSGQTVGPRLELLREAHEYCAQKILIYQTDRFLEFATEKAGRTVDVSAVEEIRAVDSLRAAFNIVRIVTQNVCTCSTTQSNGQLVVEITRPTYTFTASGHFSPHLQSAPAVRVQLTESPQPLPRYRIGCGSGTNHDFHIHLKSEEYGVTLPPGQYIFEYKAEVSMNDADSVRSESTEI